jgi:predicted acylesterase/phospholipase RssA/CRP-like cAMP-binding protein
MDAGQRLEQWKHLGLFLELDSPGTARVAAELFEIRLVAGSCLFQRGEPSDTVYLVRNGALEILGGPDGTAVIGVMHPGEPVGELHFLAGGQHTATVKALEDSLLICLSRSTFESASRSCPALAREMEDLIRRRLRHYRMETVLPQLFGSLSQELLAELERTASWVRLPRGQRLCAQGDAGQDFYVLMRGRLVAEVETDSARHMAGYIFPGESVGEMAVFTGEARSANVYAARDSEAIRISPETFKDLASQHPEFVMQMTRIIIRRLRQSIGSQPRRIGVTNLALIPVSGGIEAGEFARSLAPLMDKAKVLHLSSKSVDEALGSSGAATMSEDDPNAMRLEIWLDERESAYDFIFFEPDATCTPWSRRCVLRADRILLLADADADPLPGGFERGLLSDGVAADVPATLVLLHPDDEILPSGTDRWLSCRTVEAWVHLRRRNKADHARLARLLTGKAVAVVLSGGGAKGFAHIGVLRAFEEQGIPVDMIGGTSMGAIVAAGHALGLSSGQIGSALKRLFAAHRPFNDYTLPLVSMLKGRKLKDMILEQFGSTRIEDLWIGFFCVATDLTAAEARLHQSGPVASALLSSIAIPGIIPPVIAGDRLLVDGGVVNNLPGDVMRTLCRGTLVAVDVAPKRDIEVPDGCSEYPSAWQILRQRFLPRRLGSRIPTLPQLVFRTTMLGSINRVNSVKAIADFYLRPPVESFGMLQFDAIDEIVDVGYHYAKAELENRVAPALVDDGKHIDARPDSPVRPGSCS